MKTMLQYLLMVMLLLSAPRPAIADLTPGFGALDWSALMDMGAISRLSLMNDH